MSVERIFTLVPEPARAAGQRRRQALGRRAADAGDRPHPAHRRALPDARRADRGPRARHHPADRPHHRRAEARGLHDPARRAEFPLRLDRSPIASSSWSTAGSSTPSRAPNSRRTWASCTRLSGCESMFAGLRAGARAPSPRPPMRTSRSDPRVGTPDDKPPERVGPRSAGGGQVARPEPDEERSMTLFGHVITAARFTASC